MWNSSRRCCCSQTICREEPVFAGKVTCGVQNETSGQSWPSNTGATDHRVRLLTSEKTCLAGDFNPVTKVSESISSDASASAYAVTAITAAFSFNCCTLTLSRVSAAEW